MTIGSGRVLYQNLVKISKAVKEGTLGQSPVIKEILKESNNIHIASLLSDGGVHSHIDHIIALATISSKEGKRVYLHLITDGRDVSPTSAPSYLKQIEEINLATMTQYNKEFPYPIIFESNPPKNTLAEVISSAGLSQMHTSETEKYAHVTFFFNGGVEEPFENETRVLVPSPDVKTYDLKPQMSAKEVGENVQIAMKEGYDFIVVNFANGDMVGHTGNYEAGIKAVEAVDAELGKIIEVVKEEGYSLVLTSDHGNCEQMKDSSGKTLTNHTTFDVFCFVMSQGVREVKPGGLNNIASTVLKLMNLDIPKEMDGALV